MLTKLHEQGSKLIIERAQDVEPILNDCIARHNEGLHGSSDMRHAARIPNVIIERYINTHNITFQEFMNNDEHIKAMLNDPSLAHFRIYKGQV